MAVPDAVVTRRPARIALVGPFGLAPRGTTARRALPLARALAGRGHDVRLFLVPWDTPLARGRVWREGGVTVVEASPRGGVAAAARRLLAHIAAARPHVVHVFKPRGYSGLVLWTLFWARRLGGWQGRLALDCDDWESGWNDLLGDPAWLRAAFAWQERWCLRHADCVTVASRWLADFAAVVRRPGAAPVHVPNGVERRWGAGESTSRRQAAAAPRLIVATRFAEVTPERILRVWHAVQNVIPPATLYVAGDSLPRRGPGPADQTGEAARLARLAEAAGLGGSLHILGWVPAQAWPGVVAAADVAWLPAADTLRNRARCPARLADFLAAGLPVVADAVGEAGSYIEPGKNGWLVPPGDDAATVEALCRLLREPQRRSQMGRAAAMSMQRSFTWDELAGRVEAAYEIEEMGGLPS